MTHTATRRTLLAVSLLTVVAGAQAAVDRSLPYPSGTPSADDIIDQVYYVNHFYAFDNYGITEVGRDITVLINKSKDRVPTTVTLERYLNNKYPPDDEIKAQDIAIFRSGKLRGTGMLITDFRDDSKSQSYSIWLPALRKIRRFAEPAHDDAWGGTDFTFGDVTLRKPKHETHELLGEETFNECLGFVELEKKDKNRYMQDLPEPSCTPKGRPVYKVKSTTKFKGWWYDYRVSYIDKETFADYRTEYFKDGTMVKVIDRDWKKAPGVDDPRAMYWGYWYGKTLDTGHETWAVIPNDVNVFNADRPQNFWSETTLRRIKR
jgi:hypothetical protein